MKLWFDICEEALGKKTQHKEWISSDTFTIKKIEKRKETKAILIISRTCGAKVKAQE
jgi:hypothetical protein